MKAETVGIVTLHVNRTLPRALELAGKVIGCNQRGNQYRVAFVFDGVAANVLDLLEKMIFRHHRRAIALKREQA